jgi:hypothetical protein
LSCKISTPAVPLALERRWKGGKEPLHFVYRYPQVLGLGLMNVQSALASILPVGFRHKEVLMRASIVIALSLLAPGTSQASTVADLARTRCDKSASTQYAIDECAQSESRRVDAQEAALYKRLVVAVGRITGASGQVQAAENSWKQYRTHYIRHCRGWPSTTTAALDRC